MIQVVRLTGAEHGGIAPHDVVLVTISRHHPLIGAEVDDEPHRGHDHQPILLARVRPLGIVHDLHHRQAVEEPGRGGIVRFLQGPDETGRVFLHHVLQGPRVREVLVPGNPVPLAADVDVKPLIGELLREG